MIPKITDFNAPSIPILNKILEDINLDKPKIVYAKAAPTTNNVNKGELHVYDDGNGLRRMYFKTHLGNLSYLNLGDAGDTFTVLPIERGGTYNTAFTEGYFIAYDGTRLISTPYNSSSFPTIEQLLGQFVPYVGATQDVDLGAHSLTIAAGEKIIFDGA